jgi:hypothetical protein|nr:MAG TPA: P-loop Nucleotide Kinase3 [Caudoviricetes sp.]
MNKNVRYLVGTSGSGKTSLAHSLEKRGFNWIRGAVSRPTCLSPFERHVIIGEPRFARDALGEGLLVVLLWAHPQNAREGALRSDWVEDGPTASARLRYRFAVCRNDTYWERSQVIDFVEREAVFD